jgi:hypothetical protein
MVPNNDQHQPNLGMKSIKTVVYINILMVVAIACSPKNTERQHERQEVTPSDGPRRFTLTLLKRELIGGMSYASVIERFGVPLSERTLDDGKRLTYIGDSLINWPEHPDDAVAGFVVYFKNQSLMRWEAIESRFSLPEIMGQQDNMENSIVSESGEAKETRIQFFIVHDASVPSGRYVDTATFPKLGYVKQSPDLLISNIFSAYIAATENIVHANSASRSELVIELDVEGSERLKEWTSIHKGVRVLITSEEVVISAPVIAETINSGRVSLELMSGQDIPAILRALNGDRGGDSPSPE